jgi:hypothetical protein
MAIFLVALALANFGIFLSIRSQLSVIAQLQRAIHIELLKISSVLGKAWEHSARMRGWDG